MSDSLTKKVKQTDTILLHYQEQKKVTRLKYLSTKGYAVLTEEDLDDIINEGSSKGIYNMTLGLSDKKSRELVMN